MKEVILFIALQTICFGAFCQNPRWIEFGTRIPAVTNLDVLWNTPTNFGVGSNVPTNAWHSNLGIYRLLPRHFSTQSISNLMAMFSFTGRDKTTQGSEEMAFKKDRKLLTISFSSGSIEYEMPERRYGPTNLAKDVPSEERLPELVTNFLNIVGISPSEIMLNSHGVPAFNFSEPYSWFYIGGETITNVPFRSVVMSRAVEGAQVIGLPGHCRLEFGEHGAIIQIQLSWPSLELVKNVRTLGPSAIMRSFQQGKALQGFLPSGFGDIDWFKVKSVTINQAWPCYFAGTTRVMYPFLALWARVETDHGNADIEIDCPILDESGL
jgi:hypothetical protein